VVGTHAAAAVAGVSRRTLGRRVAAGELAVRHDDRGRMCFHTGDLARLRVRDAGRPATPADTAVRRATSLREAGYSLRTIASTLEREGTAAPAGGERWWASSVRHLLARVERDGTSNAHGPGHQRWSTD
jgi:hypothetical protein